jgi:hypothetical protein
MHPFAPRPISFQGILIYGQWRLKHYTITYADKAADSRDEAWAAFAQGRSIAFALLPTPARTEERPGAALLIEHRGRGVDYIVLGWWDRENELPVRVMVRDDNPHAAWRPAKPNESFCVWDLQIMGFERDAYVNTVLASIPLSAALEKYMATSLQPAASGKSS